LDNHKKLRVVLVAITLVLVLIYVIRQDIASVFVNDVRTNYWGYEFRESNLTKSIQMLEFDDDFEKIEVQKVIGVDASTANTIMMNNIAVFRSLFEKQRVGYRGQHTEYIECPDEFKPKYSSRTIENGTLHYFLGFANNRLSTISALGTIHSVRRPSLTKSGVIRDVIDFIDDLILTLLKTHQVWR
jgi:hypothetical protein